MEELTNMIGSNLARMSEQAESALQAQAAGALGDPSEAAGMLGAGAALGDDADLQAEMMARMKAKKDEEETRGKNLRNETEQLRAQKQEEMRAVKILEE